MQVMPVIFRVRGNQSQPGLQLVETLATPLRSTRISIFLKPPIFHTDRPTVHTKPANPLTETPSFRNLFAERFRTAPFTRIRVTKHAVSKMPGLVHIFLIRIHVSGFTDFFWTEGQFV